MRLKIDATFEEKLISYSKNDKNLVNFDLSTRNSQNFHSDWFRLCKVYNVWPKKSRGVSYLSWHWRVMENLKKNWLVVWKMTWGIWQIFTRALEKSQNWDFDGILLSKVENVWASTLQSSYVSWQWRMMQNLKRNWLVVSKLTWGIWRILTRTLKSLKNLHFNGLLLNKVYNVWA